MTAEQGNCGRFGSLTCWSYEDLFLLYQRVIQIWDVDILDSEQVTSLGNIMAGANFTTLELDVIPDISIDEAVIVKIPAEKWQMVSDEQLRALTQEQAYVLKTNVLEHFDNKRKAIILEMAGEGVPEEIPEDDIAALPIGPNTNNSHMPGNEEQSDGDAKPPASGNEDHFRSDGDDEGLDEGDGDANSPVGDGKGLDEGDRNVGPPVGDDEGLDDGDAKPPNSDDEGLDEVGGNAKPPVRDDKSLDEGDGNAKPPVSDDESLDEGDENAKPPVRDDKGLDKGNGNIRPPVPGEGDVKAPVPGKGDAKPLGPGEGDAKPPGPGEGDAKPPVPGEGDAKSPGLGEGDAKPPGPGEGDAKPLGPGEGDAKPLGPGEGDAKPPGPGEGDAKPPGLSDKDKESGLPNEQLDRDSVRDDAVGENGRHSVVSKTIRLLGDLSKLKKEQIQKLKDEELPPSVMAQLPEEEIDIELVDQLGEQTKTPKQMAILQSKLRKKIPSTQKEVSKLLKWMSIRKLKKVKDDIVRHLRPDISTMDRRQASSF
ncbi:neurofilament heavy polypeptide-like [Liolophura sinensis]|uniref:neurofilament heavy polypeptide-like n=1 Tax=Liolophura sinensis TaxID=3198878 RepID=UPI00315905A5